MPLAPSLPLGAVILATLVATGASVPSPSAQGGSLCRPDTTIGHPAPDLWCIPLVPRPDLPDASGLVELRQAETPFDLAVTRDGHHRHQLVATITGLPDPALLDGSRAYVAWATTPQFDPMVRLGEVTNGVTELGEVSLTKFLILVSAESDPATVTRQGRLVLRGTSPSIRMERHLLPVLTEGEGSLSDRHGDHSPWPMPPMRPGMSPMPGIAGLTPGATPFLPTASDTAAIAESRPRELLTLADGDSLVLVAGLVRRTFQDRTVLMYGYNGQYPGPLLRVPQGATITVHFQNAIGDSSTIHWHGLRLDNRFDGVPGVTQAPVPPGGSFRYRVHFPDAGIYWYHPHVREEIQQDLGLYGNMLVDPASPAWYSPVHREEVLMLDDLLLGETGPIPWGADATTHALMGRFGNVLLVNGDPDYSLSVERAEVVRFFLTNVSNTRTFNLGFGSARVKVVGADLGRFEREAWAESVVIAPAQRYIVEVQFTEPGRHAITNRVQGIDHVVGAFLSEVDTLGTVEVRTTLVTPSLTADFSRLRHDGDLTREVNRYRDRRLLPPDHELVLTLRTRDLPPALTEALQLDLPWFPAVEWNSTMPMMDWLPTSDQVEWILRDRATGRENMDINWRFRVGSTVAIQLVNDRNTLHAMAHPVHFHGQRVLVLARNGEPVPNLVWKDTLLLPAGSTALVLLELSNPGRWMVHCHIAEHLSAGMMTLMTVDP